MTVSSLSSRSSNHAVEEGAKVNVISNEVFQQLPNEPKLRKMNTVLKPYGSGNLQPLKSAVIQARINGKIKYLKFYINGSNAPTLIGLPTCSESKFLHRTDWVKSFAEKNNLCSVHRYMRNLPIYSKVLVVYKKSTTSQLIYQNNQ
ncbi:hypothetical protein HELRODRAFT_181221 [Helobdella robusta]|uniref:Uncharacterized protein n=1 Tax=Helobdella robusta TaxID=6412 RepID=T1FGR6_HELRO|nr:hypothetical protein HELRODRAFT_181221 [Helobdella robusta]ESN93125.1 hypothetical protein HELRODRAFT_181221 [Helobdella robusta]